MGYQIAPENGNIYAFKNIDPRKENEQDPSFWCFAHFIQHGSLENANVVVDKKGGLRLARNVNGDYHVKNYSLIIIVALNAKNAIRRCTRQKKRRKEEDNVLF
mmetsp:Transcript_8509/g.12427  ORF Transcript_8509/g.12427 Transcript_8509/m.12427 type:complete len:103 (-) Transcript_8509:62-370(-)